MSENANQCQKKISIIIPSYNCGRYIQDALNSVLEQSYNDYEVIIVDDGSTDDTRDRVVAFGNDKIKYIYQENQGVSEARNRGILEASGELLAFLDADDVYLPIFLMEMSKKLKDGFDWVVCDNIKENIDVFSGEKMQTFELRQLENNWDSDALLNAFLIRDRVGSPNKIMVKREALLKNRITFDKNLKSREDWDFCLQLLENKCTLGWVKEPLVIYRIRNDNSNTTRKLGLKWLDYTYLLLEKHKSFFCKQNIRNVLANHYYALARHYWTETKNIKNTARCLLRSFFYGGLGNLEKTLKNKFFGKRK